MPDAVILPGSDDLDPGAEIASTAAHDAAVAEGGAEVRAQLAEESATEAQAAAEVAVAAAVENAQTAAAVIEAQASAEGSVEEARSLTDSIAEMHKAQMAAIAALGEELRAGREAGRQAPVADDRPARAERPPGNSKPRWVRR